MSREYLSREYMSRVYLSREYRLYHISLESMVYVYMSIVSLESMVYVLCLEYLSSVSL